MLEGQLTIVPREKKYTLI